MDTAYLTLTVPAQEAERTRIILEAADLDDYTGMFDDPAERQFEWEDAPWGASYLSDGDPGGRHGVTGALIDAGIPFTARDGGHYTWDPYEWRWVPGMDQPTERANTEEGDAALHAATYRAARHRLIGELDTYGHVMAGDPLAELVEWLDGYFSDDPARWTLPEEEVTR